MKTIFSVTLTPANALDAIKNFFAKINELAGQEIVSLVGTTVTFKDGGKLVDIQKTTSAKFLDRDIAELLDDPQTLSFIVSGNVARYGLLSHGLYDKIKVGPGENKDGLIIGVPN